MNTLDKDYAAGLWTIVIPLAFRSTRRRIGTIRTISKIRSGSETL
jgi:hypothetical protein